MNNCGFNLALPTSGKGVHTVSKICRDLQMAEQVGMKILVHDESTYGFKGYIDLAKENQYSYDETYAMLERDKTHIQSNIDTFKQYDSFQGVNVYDEPSMDYFNAIKACHDWFLKYYPGYEFYFVLLPIEAPDERLWGSMAGQGKTYSDYLYEFSKILSGSLSSDYYPILNDGKGNIVIKEDYYKNLNMIAAEAKAHNIPVYVYVQTMGFLNRPQITTYEEVAWQVYTSMAFGVEGIITFQYWPQLQDGDNVSDGIVKHDGTPTALYDKVKQVFDEVKGMQDAYLHYQWNGVYAHDAGGDNEMFSVMGTHLSGLEAIATVNCSQDVIIGEFKDEENRYAYMVTNATSPLEPKSATVSLSFSQEYNWAMVIQKGERTVMKLNNHVLNMTIGSGEGSFVVPLKTATK